MKIFRVVKKFIELSRWFSRKSQHYILGNWFEYTDNWNYEKGCYDWKRYKYIVRFPKAYIKFMGYSRRDIFNP